MTTKYQHKLNRRTLLKGMLGATTVTVGLPLLDFFTNNNGNALADGGAFPCRAGWWFWGNGVIPEKWFPKSVGFDYELNEEMLGRVPGEGFVARGVHSNITIVSGARVNANSVLAHLDGPTGFFAGRVLQLNERSFATPSFDSVLRNSAFGASTAFRSIETGTLAPNEGAYNGTYSQNGMASLNEPVRRPLELYNRLFGAPMTGDTGNAETLWRLEQSSLSVVRDDIERVKRLVGTNDRRRLDQHFTQIRELELQLQSRIDAPATPVACPSSVAAPAAEDPAAVIDHAFAQTRHRALADLMSIALACDMTRVFTHMFSTSTDDTTYFGTERGHHTSSHEAHLQGDVHVITTAIMDEFAYFVQRMKDIPEGDGTMLDNMILVGTTDTSRGRAHNFDNYPVMLAGSAGGKLVTGTHIATQGDNVAKIPLTILRTLNQNAPFWGYDAMRVTESLSELEV